MVDKETFRARVNGAQREVSIEPHRTLLEALREELGLTGSKRGCDDGSCGSCTVLVDGAPRLSCLTLALLVEGRDIVTIEGAIERPLVARLLDGLVAGGGLQCGFCTPGIVVAASALLGCASTPSEEDVREAISGNLCRCTGYGSIVEAVRKVASPCARGAAASPREFAGEAGG